MVHKIAIFDAFKWNKLPLHSSSYPTVKFHQSLYQTYKNKSGGECNTYISLFLPPGIKRGVRENEVA